MSAATIPHASEAVAKTIVYELAAFERLYEPLKAAASESASFIPGEVELLGTGHAEGEEQQIGDQLECFLLHARVLRDFFFFREVRKAGSPRPRKDDVLAEHYVRSWLTHSPKKVDYLREHKDRLDKTLAHLSTKRVRFNEKQKTWNVAAIWNELKPAIDYFRANLPAESRPWFSQA